MRKLLAAEWLHIRTTRSILFLFLGTALLALLFSNNAFSRLPDQFVLDYTTEPLIYVPRHEVVLLRLLPTATNLFIFIGTACAAIISGTAFFRRQPVLLLYSGYSRAGIFLSKLFFYYLLLFMLSLVHPAVAFFSYGGTWLTHFNPDSLSGYIALFLYRGLVLCAYASIFFAIACYFRDVFITLAASTGVLAVMILLVLLNSAVDLSPVLHFVPPFSLGRIDNPAAFTVPLAPALCAAAFLIGFSALAYHFFRKAEF